MKKINVFFMLLASIVCSIFLGKQEAVAGPWNIYRVDAASEVVINGPAVINKVWVSTGGVDTFDWAIVMDSANIVGVAGPSAYSGSIISPTLIFPTTTFTDAMFNSRVDYGGDDGGVFVSSGITVFKTVGTSGNGRTVFIKARRGFN